MAPDEKIAYQRAIMVDNAKRWLGTPYIWNNQDFSGFDCSGFCHEVLQSVGLERNRFDSTAHEMYIHFKPYVRETGGKGCLVFWFKDGKTIHVEIMVDDYHTVGASGGSSRTRTVADAIRDDAFVKMRPLHYRGDNFKIVDPFKAVE